MTKEELKLKISQYRNLLLYINDTDVKEELFKQMRYYEFLLKHHKG